MKGLTLPCNTLYPPRVLSIDQACHYIAGLSPNTLKRLLNQAAVRPVSLGGTRIGYHREDLDRFADELRGPVAANDNDQYVLDLEEIARRRL
jgi:hypothetical protein